MPSNNSVNLNNYPARRDFVVHTSLLAMISCVPVIASVNASLASDRQADRKQSLNYMRS